MLTTTSITTTWRRTCCVAFVLAPALAVVLDRIAAWVLPQDYGEGLPAVVAQLQQIHAHDLAWRVGCYVALAWGLATVVATLGLLDLTRRGAPRLSAATAVVLLPGAVGLFAHAVFYNIVFGAMSRVPDLTGMATFVDVMEAYPPFWVALLVVIAGTIVGVGLSCFALWRSRVVPGWVAALAGVYPVAELLSLNGWWDLGGAVAWLVAWSFLARAGWRARPERPTTSPAPGRTAAVSG